MPSFLRLVASALAGVGAVAGFQLGIVVARPPGDSPQTLLVDDYRVQLYLGMLAMFAVSFLAIRDNLQQLRRPSADQKSKQENE
jgi:pilus assembly protein TadC